MPGPIARAFVDIVARADGFGDDVADQLRRELRGLDRDVARILNRVEDQFRQTGVIAASALDGIGEGAKTEAAQILIAFERALEGVEDQFGEMSAAGRRNINQLKRSLRGLAGARVAGLAALSDPGVGDPQRATFLRARADITREMERLRVASEAAGRSVSQVGREFREIGFQARRTAERASGFFDDMTREIRQDIARIARAPGFDQLFIRAAETTERIEGQFEEMARDIAVSLRRAAATPAFAEIRVQVEAVAEAIENEIREASVRANAALRTIGEGGNFRELENDSRRAKEVLEREMGGAALRVSALLGTIDNSLDLGKMLLESRAAAEGIEQIGQEAVGTSARLATMSAVGAAGVRGIASDSRRSRRDLTFLRKTVGNIIQTAAIIGTFALATVPFAVGGFGLKIASEFEKIENALVGLTRAENVEFFGDLATQLSSGVGPAAQLRDNLRDLRIDVPEGFDFNLEAARFQTQGLLGDVRELALNAPVGFREVAQGVAQLVAAGRETGQATQDLEGLLGLLVGLGVENPAENIGRLTLGLGQIGASARVDLRDVRQLREALPGFDPFEATVARVAMDEYGGSIERAREAIRGGVVDGEQFVDAFLRAVADSPIAVGALERAVLTLQGQFEKLKESAEFALRDGFAPLVGFLNSEAINVGDTFVQSLGDSINAGIAGIAAGVVTAIQEVGPALVATLEPIGAILGNVFAAGGGALAGFLDEFQPSLELLAETLAQIADDGGLRDIGEAAGELAGALTDVFAAGLPALVDLLVLLADVLRLLPDDLLATVFAFALLRRTLGRLGIAVTVAGLVTQFGKLRAIFLAPGVGAAATGFFATLARRIGFGFLAAQTAIAAGGGGLIATIRGVAAGITTALGPIGIALAGAAILGTIVFGRINENRRQAAEFRALVSETAEAIRQDLNDPALTFDDAVRDNMNAASTELLRGRARLRRELADQTLDANVRVRLRGIDTSQLDIRDVFDQIGEGQTLDDIFDAAGLGEDDLRRLERSGDRAAFDAANAFEGSLRRTFEVLGDAAREVLDDPGFKLPGTLDNLILNEITRELGLGDFDDLDLDAAADELVAFIYRQYSGSLDRAFVERTPRELETVLGPLAGDFNEAINEALGEFFKIEPSADRVRTEGLEDELTQLVAGVLSGALPDDQAISDFVSDLGLSAELGVILGQAAADVITGAVEGANRFLGAISVPSLLISTDDFASQFLPELKLDELASAFARNLADQLQLVVGRLDAEQIIAEADLAGLSEQVRSFVLALVQLPDEPGANLLVTEVGKIIEGATDPAELEAALRRLFASGDPTKDVFGAIQAAFERFTATLPPGVSIDFTEFVRRLFTGELDTEALEGIGFEAAEAAAEAVAAGFIAVPFEDRLQARLTAAFAALGTLDFTGFLGGIRGFLGALAGGADGAGPALTGDDVISPAAQATIKSDLEKLGEDAGTGMGTKVADSLRGSASKIASAVQSLLPRLRLEGVAMGAALAEGIEAGISSKQSEAVIAATRLALAAKAAIEGALGISSPSTVGIGLGAEFSRGVAMGISSLSGDVVRASSALAGAANTPLGTPAVGGIGGAGVSNAQIQQLIAAIAANPGIVFEAGAIPVDARGQGVGGAADQVGTVLTWHLGGVRGLTGRRDR